MGKEPTLLLLLLLLLLLTVVYYLQTPLVGELGQSTIQKVLSHTENPGNAIREIQIKASLRNHQCRPLLILLDELGITRCIHSYIIHSYTVLLQPLPLAPEVRALEVENACRVA